MDQSVDTPVHHSTQAIKEHILFHRHVLRFATPEILVSCFTGAMVKSVQGKQLQLLRLYFFLKVVRVTSLFIFCFDSCTIDGGRAVNALDSFSNRCDIYKVS